MQKNNFEKQVQQQLEDFSLPPADAVWQKVADRIAQDKKRRRIFAWMFAGILLLGGAGFWLVSDKDDNQIASTIKKTNVITYDKNQPIEETGNDGKPLVKEDNAERTIKENKIENVEKDLKTGNREVALAPGSRNSFREMKNEKRQSTSSSISLNNAKEKNDKSDRSKNAFVLTEKPALNESSTVIHDAEKDQEKSTKTNAEETTRLTTEVSAAIETVKPQPSAEIKTTTETTEAKSLAVKKVSNKKKQLLFGVTLSGGVSDNTNSRLFPMNKSADAAFQNSPATGQSSQPTFVYNPRYNYNSSYSWGVGAFAQQEISRTFNVTVGINYQLMNAKLSTGSKVDSIKTFNDSALMKTTTVAVFYRPGATNNYRNSYHLLQIPVDAVLRLNKNPETPFSLSAGFTAGVLIGSKALYLNDRARNYYEEKDQFNRLFLSVQTGLSFTLYNSPKHQLQLGPSIQYQISNLTKPAIKSNEHLLFLGVKGNLLFKSFNK